jgi:hypothetical protein
MPRLRIVLLLLLASLWISSATALAQWRDYVPEAITRTHLSIHTHAGRGDLVVFAEPDSERSQPAVRRLIVVIPGSSRNSEGLMRTLQKVRYLVQVSPRETVIVSPQFLNEADEHAEELRYEFLRWHGLEWEYGNAAYHPANILSYEVMDAVLEQFTGAHIFPNLREVVFVASGGGGVLLTRYAAVGHQLEKLEKEHIKLRFVLIHNSSFLYFDAERPRQEG